MNEARGATDADRMVASPNDGVGEETRLRLYRRQVVDQAEPRAYDLFLQNLLMGTSHLSLGQEAIAAHFAVAVKPGDLSFCIYRGHAHTLARGVSIVLEDIVLRSVDSSAERARQSLQS